MLYYIAYILAAYIICGILVAMFLMQTPYADNGWLNILLLWPLYVYAFFSS